MRRFILLTIFFIFIALFFLHPKPVYTATGVVPPVAQPCPNQSQNPRVQNGLISTPYLWSTQFSNSAGYCLIDAQQAPFAPYAIDNFDDLKSIYYTQAKAGNVNPPDSSSTIVSPPAESKVYNYTNTVGVSINSQMVYARTAVIFVDHDLSINNNIIGTPGIGLVFVVGGDVIIAPTTVTQIDAVIISSGRIYTAGAGCAVSSVDTVSPLVIYGSLVSIYKDQSHADSCNSATPPTDCPVINFCRKLADNSCSNCAAEKIYQQPKYLVILRDLYSTSIQKWSEVTQ